MRCSGFLVPRLRAEEDLCERVAGILPACDEGVPPARAKAPASAGDGPPSSDSAATTGATHKNVRPIGLLELLNFLFVWAGPLVRLLYSRLPEFQLA